LFCASYTPKNAVPHSKYVINCHHTSSLFVRHDDSLNIYMTYISLHTNAFFQWDMTKYSPKCSTIRLCRASLNTYSIQYVGRYQQCKHGLGMQIRREKAQVPVEAKNYLLGQRRKRGRPRKANTGLLVQIRWLDLFFLPFLIMIIAQWNKKN